MMDLAMMGCGTGAIIEPRLIDQLPVVLNPIEVLSVSDIGVTPAGQRQETTTHTIEGNTVSIKVGDTRRGWVDSYQLLLELCSDERFKGETVQVRVDLSDVRPVGETLKGFGGMANPVKLKDLYARVARLLGKAIGRRLTSVECCLLIDEAAVTIVAGNIRRSAGMRQFAADDHAAASAKDNLWQQDEEGNWRIDPSGMPCEWPTTRGFTTPAPANRFCLMRSRSSSTAVRAPFSSHLRPLPVPTPTCYHSRTRPGIYC